MRVGGRLFAAAAVVGLVSTSATGQQVGWHSFSDEGYTNLFYGVPESSDFAILFACEDGSSNLSFVYSLETDAIEAGQQVELELSTGDIAVILPAESFFSDMDDSYSLDGQSVLDDRLAELITSQGTLRINAQGNIVELPLDGAREAAGDLLEKCRPA